MADKNFIQFGKIEEESPHDYANMTARLNLHASGETVEANIGFTIESGSEVGQFDMDRNRESCVLSLKDAEQLIEKLTQFVATGKKFIKDYQA